MALDMSRRQFVGASAAAAGTLSATGALSAYYARDAAAQAREAAGYGELVLKGELWLPPDFNYQVVSRQGTPQRIGGPTPGIFDGMGAFPDTRRGRGTPGDTTILIRNHENRERAGEQKVVTGPFEYDPLTFGGCTKMVVRRRRTGERDARGNDLYAYELVDSFNILGGTSTNCAGGILPWKKWVTAEEVVKRSPNGLKHGYLFEVDAMADGPVQAVPIPQAGRMAHEAIAFTSGVMYETEDRSIAADPNGPAGAGGEIGAVFYRWVPDRRIGQSGNLAETPGVLQAAALRSQPRANMDTGRNLVGVPQEVEWVTVDEPDHDDDSDNRRDRVPGFTPTRVQAIDKGACYFDRCEGIWEDHGKVYFDATTGGPQNLGQVWEYDPGRETLTLIYESTDSARLENPDNVVIVPQTGDIFLQEDSNGDQYVRGLTQDGQIYDFVRNGVNDTEFCGGCFDPDGQTLYLNQQGERGGLPDGPPDGSAVTYAIYGPFEKRAGNNSRNFGTGPSV